MLIWLNCRFSAASPLNALKTSLLKAVAASEQSSRPLQTHVETDGSVDPRGALSEGAAILIERLALFADPEATRLLGQEPPEEPAPGGGMHDIMIEELELGVRSYNCLKRVGVETIGDLISKTEGELSAIPNFGKKSIEEVKENLAAHGLSLREDD